MTFICNTDIIYCITMRRKDTTESKGRSTAFVCLRAGCVCDCRSLSMLSNHEIADMNYCRRCINQKYRIHLKRSEVIVLQMMYPCARCGEMKHPVHAVKWNARWKLLFAHARRRKEP